MTIDDALIGVHLGRCESHLVRIMIAGRGNARQDLAHFRFVVNKLEQRLTMRALAADAQDVFCGRVQVHDELMLIKQNDACAQAVENIARIVVERPAAGIVVT